MVFSKKSLAATLLLSAIGYKIFRAYSPSKVKDFKGKSVLVTGAAGGLGRQVCIEIAKKKEAKTFILWDIQEAEARKTADLIKSFDSNAVVLVQKVNLADRSDIYGKASEAIQFLGGDSPQVVINNAGIVSGNQGCLDTDDKKIELETQINTLAHVWIAKAFIPRMAASGKGGHFLNVASMAAYISAGDLATYSMSKKGAKGFAEGLNAEMKLKGLDKLIKVGVLCPGHFTTELFAGFQGDGLSMTPEFVAQKMVQAIECEQEITVLPPLIKPVVLVIALSEFFGSLNLPNVDNKYQPMKNWKNQQAEKLFNQMGSK